MTRFDYILAVLAGAAYILLIGFLVSITMTWGDPISTIRAVCPGKSAADFYFAEGTFDSEAAELDAFIRKWYSAQLSAMDEPSISCGAPGQVYRFVWLRTFHHPVVVRIAKSDTGVSLSAVELDGAGGYEPGSVLRRVQRPLSLSQLKELQGSLADKNFWSMAMRSDQLGEDGSEWIIEVAENGNYHIVTRWSPRQGAVREIGLRFLHLAGWEFDRIY